MKSSISPRCVIILYFVVLCVDGYAAVLKDSIDVRVNRALDSVYEHLYFVDYVRAARAFDRQISIASAAGRWHIVVSALTLKAKCAYNHYLANETYACLLQAEAIADKYQAALDSLDPVREYRSEIHYVRGMHFHEAGDYSRSINSFQSIIENHRRYQGIDTLYLYYVYSFIGHASLKLMLFDKAYLNYEEALAMLSKSGADAGSYQYAMLNIYKGQCLEYRAKFLNDPNQARQATAFYKRALRILLPDKKNVAYRGALTSSYNRLAAVSSLLLDHDSTIYYLSQSRQFQVGEDPTLSLTYTDLGHAYEQKGKYATALKLYDEAISIAAKSYQGTHFQKGLPALRKSELLLNKGDYRLALEACQFALAQFVGDFQGMDDLNTLPAIDYTMNVPLVVDALTLKGRIFFAQYTSSGSKDQLDRSLSCYRDAIKAIQDAQMRYPDGEYRQNLAAKSQPLYEHALEAAFSGHEKDESDPLMSQMIFDLIESSKATILRDASATTGALEFKDVPDAVLEAESLLKGSIASMRAQLYQSPNDTAVAVWKRDLLKLTTRYDSLLELISKNHPDYFAFRYGMKRLPVGDIQKKLSSGTLLIEYFWGERSVYVVAVSKSAIQLRRILADQEITSHVLALMKSLSQGNQDNQSNDAIEFSRTSYAIYSRLLEPVMTKFEHEEVTSLVVVPDGILSYIPFDVLVTSRGPHADFQSMPFLLKRYAVRTLFTAHELSDNGKATEYQSSYIGFAPTYDPDLGITMVGSEVPVYPGALSYNLDEVTGAATLFKGRMFLHQEATEENFRTVSGDGRVLHLSMHGIVNDHDPSFSALLFAQPELTNESRVDSDGQLYLHELYNLRANVEMVVLSACETGGGRYAKGEGIMSLGRAFRYAGCENIVMSLWKVNDHTTARLMKAFFNNINRGDNKDEALRDAKLEFILDPQNRYFTHPYYWSGFILVGNTSPVFARRIGLPLKALIFGIPILLVLAVLYLRKR